jgi:hypothetical protein
MRLSEDPYYSLSVDAQARITSCICRHSAAKKSPRVVHLLPPSLIMAALLKQFQGTFASPPASLPETVNTSALPLHPYYPIEATIVGYVANKWNTFELCSLFASGCAVIFAITYLVAKRVRPNVSASDLSVILWFMLCEFG